VIKGLSVAGMYELAERVDAFREGGIGVYPERIHSRRHTRGADPLGHLDGKYVSLEEAMTTNGGDRNAAV
jgi:hypothetical protein